MRLPLVFVGTALCCAALLASCTSQAVSDSQPPTVKSLLNQGQYVPDIATFLQIGGCTAAGLSWDGRDAYFTSSMSGASQIYRLTPEGWPYQLTTFEDGVDFFELSPNGAMAIVGASVGGSEQSDLHLMDTRTGRVVRLTEGQKVQYASVVWSPDNRQIYFRSNEENGKDFLVYQMDIATGNYEKIFGMEGYNGPLNVSQDGTLLLMYHLTSNVANDLYLLDLASREARKITSDTGGVLYDGPVLMPDNMTIWMVCNNNEDGIPRLAKMTVDSPEIQWAPAEWADPKWPVDGLRISQDFRFLAALINEDGYGRIRLREIETGRDLKSPPVDGIITGGFFDITGSCLISFNSPTLAPDVWRWNPTNEQLDQLTFSIYAGIDRQLFREPQLIHYKSFDGLEIPAFIYLPPDYKPGEPLPFIVDAHGGPEGQTRPYFQRNIQYFLLNGFGVFAPNIRGSDGYGRKYLAMDDYKNRKHSLMDYKAGVEWLIANGYTQQGMVGIRGASYGGYVVLGMITEYPDMFGAAIDGVGIANFKTFLLNTAAYRRALREAEYGPLSDEAFLHEISPIHKAHLIKTPLLVVHGENDPRVPVSEARQIIAAIQKSGGIVDSLIFPDEGHGASKRVNVIEEYRRQVEFFTKHLKKNTPAPARKEG